MQNCYQNEARFNGVYSSDNLPKIKVGSYVINLDEHSDIGTHWVALYVDGNNNDITYFDSFGVEHIPKEIKRFINIFIFLYFLYFYIFIYFFNIYLSSLMCGYFCIGLIDFMLAGKTLTEFTNLFSLNNFKKNDNIILNYFKTNI